MIFDLDPAEGIPWKAVVEAAFRLRSLLEDIGLRSFARTTGGKGLHVVVPLLRRSSWDEMRGVAAAAADHLVSRYPTRYVRTMTKSARKGKIFIDHFRNGRGATAVAAYSTRARAGAPVATPVSWEELSEGVGPGAFSIRTVPDRLERLKQDPWKDFFAIRQSFRRDAQPALLSRESPRNRRIRGTRWSQRPHAPCGSAPSGSVTRRYPSSSMRRSRIAISIFGSSID